METPLEKEIRELDREIAALPCGHIVRKIICGKEYYFRRIGTDEHVIDDIYVDDKALDELRAQIDKREGLEKRQAELISRLPTSLTIILENHDPFETDILMKDDLRSLIKEAASFKRRDGVCQIQGFLSDSGKFDVMLISGMKGCGNTTMMYQVMADMTDEEFGKTALMRVKSDNTFMEMLHDIKKLRRLGYSRLFVDDVTNMADFLVGAGFFSRNAKQYGFKMVITGSDSLSLVFAKENALYERCLLLSTTHMLFCEFERVLGPRGIDKYLTLGGTMNPAAANTRQSSKEYIASSIARNIQNSLENFQYGGLFSHTEELHEEGKLIDAICKITDEITRQFLIRALDDKLRLDGEDENSKTLSKLRSTLDSPRFQCGVEEYAACNIRFYLENMDILREIDCVDFGVHDSEGTMDVTSQQWLVTARANFLAEDLLNSMDGLSDEGKRTVQEEISAGVRTTMMEDTVFLETKLANPSARVWAVRSLSGEPRCMVVEGNGSCVLYELRLRDKPGSHRHWERTHAEERNRSSAKSRKKKSYSSANRPVREAYVTSTSGNISGRLIPCDCHAESHSQNQLKSEPPLVSAFTHKGRDTHACKIPPFYAGRGGFVLRIS